MESNRQKKFARLIQRELSQLLSQHVERSAGCMITLTHVKVTADLQIARAYITCFPDNKLGEVLALLDAEQKKMKHLLASKISNQVKLMPNLIFYEDDSFKQAHRIEELL